MKREEFAASVAVKRIGEHAGLWGNPARGVQRSGVWVSLLGLGCPRCTWRQLDEGPIQL